MGASLRSELRGLRALIAVLDEGVVGRAAEALHLSQPAVTRALRSLESRLGFPLFDRAARGMLPTAAGRILGVRARRALGELEKGCGNAISAGLPRARAGAAPRFAALVTSPALASLIGVAEHGSGPRAAAGTGRSQPTIHRNLRDLEHLVGVPLFQRTSRGTRLTEGGDALLLGVKLAFSELAIAEDELAAFGGRLGGHVLVAALPLSSAFLLPRAIDGLLIRYPDVHVTVVDGTYDALIQQLRCAEIDLIVGALRLGGAPSDIAQEPLFEDALSVIARAGHPCLRGGGRRLGDVLAYPWIVPLPRTPARKVFEEVFRGEGATCPVARLEVNSPSVVRSLLLASDRLALLSPLQIEVELGTGQLVEVPVALERPTRTIGVATRRDGSLSPASEALLVELRSLASDVGVPRRARSRKLS